MGCHKLTYHLYPIPFQMRVSGSSQRNHNVMAGDTIEISAQAFYNMDKNQPDASVNIAPIVGGILAGMTNPTSSIMSETAQLANDLGTVAGKSSMLPTSPHSEGSGEAVQPKSGINFVLYNSSLDVVDENTGYLPVEDHINAIQNLATDYLVMNIIILTMILLNSCNVSKHIVLENKTFFNCDTIKKVSLSFSKEGICLYSVYCIVARNTTKFVIWQKRSLSILGVLLPFYKFFTATYINSYC